MDELKPVCFHLTDEEIEIVKEFIKIDREEKETLKNSHDDDYDTSEMCLELFKDMKFIDRKLASCTEFLFKQEKDRFHITFGCVVAQFDNLMLKAKTMEKIISSKVNHDA